MFEYMKCNNQQAIPREIDLSLGCSYEIKSVVDCWLTILHSYCLFTGPSAQAQKNYINALLYAVDFLYQFFNIPSEYFSFLDHAISNLEKLSESEISREELASYFEKGAIIFQSACDHTKPEEISYKELWRIKAEDYIQQACKIREHSFFISHDEKIMQLYREFADAMKLPFLKELFLSRYALYNGGKCEQEVKEDIDFSPKTEHGEEAPLLEEENKFNSETPPLEQRSDPNAFFSNPRRRKLNTPGGDDKKQTQDQNRGVKNTDQQKRSSCLIS